MATVKMTAAALDTLPNGAVVLRGAIDPAAFQALLVDDYQRDVLPLASLAGLIKAFEAGTSVPDIELGMRGERFNERTPGVVHLYDDVYIVDGQQRVTAASFVLQKGGKPHLGAAVHFHTTKEWERARFEILNAHRLKLSSNILLRNLQHDYPVIAMLYRLTQDSKFVLKGRVTWSQRASRQELISAMTFAKAIGRVHSHLGPTRYTRYDDLATGLQTVMKSIGQNVMRDNVKTFFDLIDECWGVKRIAYKEGAVYMRSTFLLALAEVLSGHLDFWRDNRLFVESSLTKKIAGFPVMDPQVTSLASSSGKSLQYLVMLLLNHINSGKRSRRLRPRGTFTLPPEEIEVVEDPDVSE
jgi:hypothetical protein